MEQVDTLIVGAGVVGLATARQLATSGREVLLLEAAAHIGTGISARNSEVIHAGLYYPSGSLKARLCVQGRDLLYEYCQARGIPHRRCGKLIVASDPQQEAALSEIASRAAANGVNELRWLDTCEAKALEPALACSAALHSPKTGIIDSHALMLALLGDAEQAGATLALKTPVLRAEATCDGFIVHTPELALHTRRLINCAGLGAQSLASKIDGLSAAYTPPLSFAKGNYFSLQGRSPFSHLIYPAPEAHGLGVHLTLDLAGQARFGPDVEWVEQEDYAVDARRSAVFYEAIRRYWPNLPDQALQPAYAGIRPKPHLPGETSRDFIISGPDEHGIPGLINLFGIESPGLTACLALAQEIENRLLS